MTQVRLLHWICKIDTTYSAKPPYPLVKVALEELQAISEIKATSAIVKNLTTKITHKKSSAGNTKKNNKKSKSGEYRSIKHSSCYFE